MYTNKLLAVLLSSVLNGYNNNVVQLFLWFWTSIYIERNQVKSVLMVIISDRKL